MSELVTLGLKTFQRSEPLRLAFLAMFTVVLAAAFLILLVTDQGQAVQVQISF